MRLNVEIFVDNPNDSHSLKPENPWSGLFSVPEIRYGGRHVFEFLSA